MKKDVEVAMAEVVRGRLLEPACTCFEVKCRKHALGNVALTIRAEKLEAVYRNLSLLQELERTHLLVIRGIAARKAKLDRATAALNAERPRGLRTQRVRRQHDANVAYWDFVAEHAGLGADMSVLRSNTFDLLRSLLVEVR